jgi:MFS family permease
MPIRQSFVVEMVGKPDVANAVALNSAVFNLTRIIGPAVAGVTIATIGLEPLFLINAASYIAVIGALVLMRPAELMPPAARAVVERNVRSVVDALVEGLRYVRNEPHILLAVCILGVVATFALNFQVVIPVYARDVLDGDAGTYGFLMSAAGFGSFLSAISIAFGQRPTLRRVLLGAAGVGVGMIGLAFSRSFPISLGLMFLVGWGMISMAASTNTIIQLSVPDVLRGRVMSVFTTTFAGATPIGGLISGTLAAFGGAPLAMLVGGVVAFLAAAAGFMRQPGGGQVALPLMTRRAARHR